MECRFVQEVPIGDPAASVVFLQVLLVHAAEDICGE